MIYIWNCFNTKFNFAKSSKKNAGILYSICRYFDDIADKYSEDQTNYLQNSIEEIKNNKSNKVNISVYSIKKESFLSTKSQKAKIWIEKSTCSDDTFKIS